MVRQRSGFTLVELIVVILIVGLLAAAVIPAMRGHFDKAKWAEGRATAGAIRRAVRACYQAATGEPDVVGRLDDASILAQLDLEAGSLDGTYFGPGDYEIRSVTASGLASVTVTGSRENAPSGSWTLRLDGSWEETALLAEGSESE